jgi:hypothetical protein
MADIVVGVDNLERTLGQGAGVLDGNQYAVEDSAGGQSPAAKIIALPASGQNKGYKASWHRKGTQGPETSFLQLIPHLNHHAADMRERPSITKRRLAFARRLA